MTDGLNTNAPKADPTLSALALLDGFVKKNYPEVAVLLDTTDERELIMGLLHISQHMATMLGNATGGNQHDVVQHVRETVMTLVKGGVWEFGTVELP